MKVSNVSRSSSLSRLERRLGKYQERRKDVTVQQGKSSQQDSKEATSEIQARKRSWEEYRAERTYYLESKKSALKELKERQKEERESLYLVQKRRRTEVFSGSWKGRGAELNQVRSILSFASQRERLRLRERQKEEMEELRSHYLRRFPSYRDWLSDQSREDLYQIYRYPGQLLLLPEQSGVRNSAPQRIADLRDYSARRGAGSSVLYCRSGTYTADFSDMGRRIVLNKRKLTEESVASALQLANQKWGATLITGNAEYKELCISAAVKYGLKLANPELSAEVERRRQELRQTRSPTVEITAEEIASLGLQDICESANGQAAIQRANSPPR